VQSLEAAYAIRLFDRTLQAFLIDNAVTLMALNQLKPAVESGQITPESVAFNNLVNTVEQLKTAWLQPAGQTWLARYFKTKAVTS